MIVVFMYQFLLS